MAEMMTEITTALPELAEKINDEHRAAETAARTALEHATRAGDLLIQAKGQCEHGTGWSGNKEGGTPPLDRESAP